MIDFERTKIGCVLLRLPFSSDDRGSFVKTYHRSSFSELESEGVISVDKFAEQYYTRSRVGTIRGMHFQIPNQDHEKIVKCVAGSMFDVVVDLRVQSPTYLQHEVFDLQPDGTALYIPKGYAHGFCIDKTDAITYYMVSTEYSPAHDTGIRWDSFGVQWPIESPIMSERDKGFVSLDQFNSPFVYTGE